MEKQTPQATKKTSSIAIDIILLITLAYWAVIHIINGLLNFFVEDWYSTPLRYVMAILWLGFGLAPFVFAAAIRNMTMKIIAIIFAFVVFGFVAYGQIDWIIYSMKEDLEF
ncbi:MAG: hypothetical protein NWQ53_03495 [Flavobacteriales bacterium]|nr:hypothetical protein [Flavobacteriales bacterium]